MGRCAIKSLFPENRSLHTLQWHGLSCVDPKMCFKIDSKWKLLVAYFTMKWFISCVDANVSIRLKKLLVAYAARIRFFTYMDTKMFVKTPMVRKLFAAQFKLICFFPLWMLRCECRWHFLLLFWVNYLSYTLSWCDCSHVWMRGCLAKHPLKEKNLIAYIAVICCFFLLYGCEYVCSDVLPMETSCLIHHYDIFFFSCVDAMVYV